MMGKSGSRMVSVGAMTFGISIPLAIILPELRFHVPHGESGSRTIVKWKRCFKNTCITGSRCRRGRRCRPSMAEPLPVAILIEDERQIRRFVRTALEAEGWNVHETETMRQGLTDAGTRKPDLIILDLGLPDADGMEFLRDLRGWSKVPVIVLSARVGEQDKIDALDAGADDYLTKPFGVGELLARVRATSRRRMPAGSDSGAIFEFGDVKIDLSLRTAHKGGAPVHLTPIEYRLLTFLIANAGK